MTWRIESLYAAGYISSILVEYCLETWIRCDAVLLRLHIIAILVQAYFAQVAVRFNRSFLGLLMTKVVFQLAFFNFEEVGSGNVSLWFSLSISVKSGMRVYLLFDAACRECCSMSWFIRNLPLTLILKVPVEVIDILPDASYVTPVMSQLEILQMIVVLLTPNTMLYSMINWLIPSLKRL